MLWIKSTSFALVEKNQKILISVNAFCIKKEKRKKNSLLFSAKQNPSDSLISAQSNIIINHAMEHLSYYVNGSGRVNETLLQIEHNTTLK